MPKLRRIEGARLVLSAPGEDDVEVTEITKARRKQEPRVVQTIICSKERFKTAAEAAAWVREHGFKTEHEGKGVDETSTSYRFRQRDPDDFDQATLRTKKLTDGVSAVVGALKKEKRIVKLLPIDKSAPDDRQIVFGEVLVPDDTDAHKDTVSPEEIEHAAHLWLARHQNRGLMHSKIVNSKVEIYESYVAPQNLTINGRRVRKGSWLLMLHILDADLWQKIKKGEITGFSMGGFARRTKL